MLFTDLKKHITTAKFRPGYILMGDDFYVVNRAAAMLKGIADNLTELNISYFDSGASASDVLAACEQLPVMADYRVIEIKNCSFDTALFKSYFTNPSPSTVIYFIADASDKNILPIINHCEVIDCNRLKSEFILRWAARECDNRGVKIEVDAVELLIEYCNRYMTRISTELFKLCDYKAEGIIQKNDVAVLVNPDIEFKIYELSDAIASKNSMRTMDILKALLSESGSASRLFSMIYTHFRRLLYVRITPDSIERSKYLGVKDFAVKMAVKQAKAFTPMQLKNICDSLSQADYDFKSGRIGDRLALETFVAYALAS